MENQFMATILVILLLLVSALWALGFYHYRHQIHSMRKLKQSLLQAHQNIDSQEAIHAQNKARWEQVEEKLRSYLQLMDTLINTIANPIYFKDAEGVYQGCNQVFARQILGLTRDRIIGKRPQELPDQIPADLAAVYQREELKMIEKEGIHTFEAQVQCADGQRRDYLFSQAPVMDRRGERSGSVVVLADLTEKNRAAQDRIQKEKLQGVLETAGAVCHEFNQPLQALSGFTELMAVKLTDHDARVYIEKITAQIERMRDITDNLQGITRYETTDYVGHTRIIDIHKASEKE
jgi:PAS domain S-box-containing protein